MLKPEVKYLEAGFVGSFQIKLPVVTIGTGKPELSILCGVHGDETGSLMTSHRFLKRLLKLNSIKGTVNIIAVANPFAQTTHTRVATSDFYDLNRMGEGDIDGSLTERLAYILINFLKDSSLVIDLHEFEMDTPVMAIKIGGESEGVNKKILENIRVFNPEIAWNTDMSTKNEAKYTATILNTLLNYNVPGFAVETSSADTLTEETIDRVANGLWSVAQNLGIVDGTPEKNNIIVYDRKVVSSDISGIWEPMKSLGEKVEKEDIIGKIIELNLIDEKTITSKYKGTIIQLCKRQLVQTGSALFSIGNINQEVTKTINTT